LAEDSTIGLQLGGLAGIVCPPLQKWDKEQDIGRRSPQQTPKGIATPTMTLLMEENCNEFLWLKLADELLRDENARTHNAGTECVWGRTIDTRHILCARTARRRRELRRHRQERETAKRTG
jgi:hypothetical protein